jgi:hypothetical protein
MIEESSSLIVDGSSKKTSRKRFVFHGYFSLLLSLSILLAGVLWLAYGYLPYQDYLPISLLSVVLVGIAAFYILNKRMTF